MVKYVALATGILVAVGSAWATPSLEEGTGFYIWRDENTCMVVPGSLIAGDPDKDTKMVGGKGYDTEDEAKAAMASEASCKS